MGRSVLGAAMLAAGLVAGTTLQGMAAGEPIVLQPVQASVEDIDPGRLYSSPALAIDPDDPRRMIAGFADLRTRRCAVMRSTDAAQTWSRGKNVPGTAEYPFCSQSQGGVIQAPVAFGGEGTVYMALGGWGEEEGARTSGAIMVSRSTDLGDNWTTTVAYSARGKTGADAENVRPVQSIAVEARKGTEDVVYITFARTKPNVTAPNAEPAQPMVSVSRDGGRTFAEPVGLVGGLFDAQAVRDQAFRAVTTTTAAPGATTTSTTAPAAGSRAATPDQAVNFASAGSRNGMVARVDSKGVAYVVWPTGTANVTPAPPSAMAVSTSRDQGRTWSSVVGIPFSYDNARGGPANAYQQLAVSPQTGSLHIVYNQNPTPAIEGRSDVFHRASYDGGATWTAPKDITDDRADLYAGQFFPNLTIAPNGRIDIAWWDTRDTPGMRLNDVYYSYSIDDGQTWSRNQRITDRSIDRNLGVWGANYD
ncbi:MAG: sialidase family protein, partial [Acidimicrobiales bacterium]